MMQPKRDLRRYTPVEVLLRRHLVKNPPADAGDERCRFHPWVRKILWRRAWQSTPLLLPGESHAQRSLVGYSP